MPSSTRIKHPIFGKKHISESWSLVTCLTEFNNDNNVFHCSWVSLVIVEVYSHDEQAPDDKEKSEFAIMDGWKTGCTYTPTLGLKGKDPQLQPISATSRTMGLISPSPWITYNLIIILNFMIKLVTIHGNDGIVPRTVVTFGFRTSRSSDRKDITNRLTGACISGRVWSSLHNKSHQFAGYLSSKWSTSYALLVQWWSKLYSNVVTGLD